jgi:hypothetical protein
MPTARFPSKTIFVAWAFVRTSMFGRLRAGRTDAPALMDGALRVADAFLDRAVAVFVQRDTVVDGTLDEIVRHGFRVTVKGDKPF